MKANTPEKIQVHLVKNDYDDWSIEGYSFLSDKQLGMTEYTRTDAFIKKANKWLSLNMKMLMNVLDVEYDTHDTDIKDFIEGFKKYMEE